MRQMRARKPDVGVSLFPFLAVLICTMGALIVLLVLVVQQARVQADSIGQQRVEQREQETQRLKELAEQEEDFLWQQEILEQQRKELTSRSSEGRLQLSHLEDHIRRLEQRWQQLQAEAAALQQHAAGEDEVAAAREEYARLRAQIDAGRAELAALREAAARRKNSYAIIPYEGPHGTRRRPIYIECLETAIIIRPENVVLTPQDFAGPLGPGNPLDAVLRAVREYRARAEGEASQGEPYPLLIVRPDGGVAYSMARAAMAGWDDEFGYELIDEETELAYPPGDPHLKQLLEATVQTARQRHAILAAAMPRRFGGPAPGGFRLSDRGYARELFGDASEGYGPAIGSPTGGGTQRPGGEGSSGAGGGPAGGADRQPFSNTAATATPAGAGERPHATATPATADRPHGGSDRDAAGPAASGEYASASGGDGAGSAAHGRAGGAAVQSVAVQQGANWALPNVAARSTGIMRPIAVECYADRLVILPDRNDSARPHVVTLEGPMRQSIQEFVSGVWNRIERWGMAVAGGYWKPVLRVRVAPGGEDRFDELSILLQDSGLEVERR